jgi:NAD-dependent SIR2 family protein deacetylase
MGLGMLNAHRYPGEYAPTPTHHFIKLLSDRGILLRNFTQNIDGLEYLAGIPADKIVQVNERYLTT